MRPPINLSLTSGLVMLLLAAPVLAHADPIEGTYAVEGTSPGGTGHYRGQALVKRTGDTYSVAWKIGRQTFIGTGLVRDKVLSVTFRPPGANTLPGVVSFEIDGDKIRNGTWAELGSMRTGSEIWTPTKP